MANFLIKSNLLVSFFRHIRRVRCFSSSFSLGNKKVPEEAIPKNLIQEYIGTHKQPNGVTYDKRPFKMHLKANKKYAWCSCGQSKSQPLCDGTHRIHSLRIKHVPVFFIVAETKDYWLCNCKQSEHKPFCDGTHKKEEIQSSIRHFKM